MLKISVQLDLNMSKFHEKNIATPLEDRRLLRCMIEGGVLDWHFLSWCWYYIAVLQNSSLYTQKEIVKKLNVEWWYSAVGQEDIDAPEI